MTSFSCVFLQTLGCIPALPGYFKAMRKVCDKYGALLILDGKNIELQADLFITLY